jgi:ATP-dependent Clp protease ATP-binding subunit ClpA
MNTEKITHALRSRLERAQEIAWSYRHSELSPVHLLLACAEAPESLIHTLVPMLESVLPRIRSYAQGMATLTHSVDAVW